MTKYEIIKFANECDLFDGIWQHPELKEIKADKFIKFAYLIAAVEREACARLCEQPITEIQITDDCSETIYKDYKDCAEFIRARGQG